MARNIYGLDLGSYEIKIYDKNHEQIWKAKNAIAVQNRKYIFATYSFIFISNPYYSIFCGGNSIGNFSVGTTIVDTPKSTVTTISGVI